MQCLKKTGQTKCKYNNYIIIDQHKAIYFA